MNTSSNIAGKASTSGEAFRNYLQNLVEYDYAALAESHGYSLVNCAVQGNSILLDVCDTKAFRLSRNDSFNEFAKMLPPQYIVEGSDGKMESYSLKAQRVSFNTMLKYFFQH